MSDSAFRLHVSALILSNRLGLDGHLSRHDLARLAPRLRHVAITELVEKGAWKPAPSGWDLVTALDHQPTAEKVAADREKAAERKARWLAEQAQRAAENAVPNTVPDAVRNGHPDPARPDPYTNEEGASAEAPIPAVPVATAVAPSTAGSPPHTDHR